MIPSSNNTIIGLYLFRVDFRFGAVELVVFGPKVSGYLTSAREYHLQYHHIYCHSLFQNKNSSSKLLNNVVRSITIISFLTLSGILVILKAAAVAAPNEILTCTT